MPHRIHILKPEHDKERWVIYNGRQSHPLPESLLKKSLAEAQGNLWSKSVVHGRKLGILLYDLLNGRGGLLDKLLHEQRDTGQMDPLYLDLPQDLSDLPFEIMANGNGFVRQNLPVLRPVSDRNRRSQKEPEQRKIKLLFMACSPRDIPVLDFEGEEETIVKILEQEKLPMDLRFEDSGSLNGLKFALRAFAPTDILHLSGHAQLGEDGPVFAMETETGSLHLAIPLDLWEAMERHPPRMLFLSGCETGKSGNGIAAGSFAREMVLRGISLVLGWGLPVSDRGATRFARSLFSYFADGFPTHEAITRARKAIEDDFGTWSQLRVFCDGTPSCPLANPKERVVYQPTRQKRYRMLQHSQVRVLEYGFVGRRRQVQRGIQVLKGEVPDKYGLLLTGTAGVGKSTLTGKLVERFPDDEIVVFPGEITELEIIRRLEDLFDRKRNKEASTILRADEPFEARIKNLLAGPLREMATLLIFDDFENGNLEAIEGAHRLVHGKAAILQPLLEALAWTEGKTRLILTSRYPFRLAAKGREWVGESLERIPLMGFHGANLQKKKRYLEHLSASAHHQIYEELSGGNPRLLEWFEALAEQQASPDPDKLEADLKDRSEQFVQEYLAELLVSAQEHAFETFLAKASVYRIPLPADAFAQMGEARFLDKAVNLTLMEKEGREEPLFWVMPLIRERQWAKVTQPEDIHQIAYACLDEYLKSQGKKGYEELDECLHHAEQGHAMEGCWHHAVTLSNYFYDRALYREGITRLLALQVYLPGKEEQYDEKAVGFINNLASLLKATNRLAEAEPLMRRALAIDEASFGPEHPNVATRLNNLATLLQATNRLAEAEPLMRRALAIDEASFGSDHPDVARDLNNLASLLQDTNRLAEAEPLMRRSMEIFSASLGNDHPYTKTVNGNYHHLLASMESSK